MSRSASKSAAQRLARALALLRMPRRGPGQRVILMYHGVSDHARFNCVSALQLRAQLHYARRHYRIVKLADLVQEIIAARDSVRLLAVTFDDAYENFVTAAYPILREMALPATVFIPTGYVGGLNEWDIRAGHPALRLMTWTQMKTLDPSLVDFGSHSVSHRAFSTLSPAEIDHEVRTSKDQIEQALGRPVSLFAYPYGNLKHVHPASASILRDAGYGAACSTQWGRFNGPEDLYALRRIEVWPNDGVLDIEHKLLGAYDWLALKEELAFRYLRRRAAGCVHAGRPPQ